MYRSRFSASLLSGVLGVLGTLDVAGIASAARPHGGGAPAAHAAAPLLVFAAASLGDVLEDVDRAFTARTHIEVRASYAASSVLAKQIEAGAPAEVFFSADLAWLDYLQKRGLVQAGTRRDVVSNSLVLIAPADSPVRLTIVPHFDLVGALAGGRLATGDPDSVPVGRYARAALTQLGVWDGVAARLVRAENVRAALEYVARGEAALGIVYRTDAQAEKRVRVVAAFPSDTHPPIVYPAVVTASAGAQAREFVEFLAGDEARGIFTHYGFTPLR
ncbi:MAG: molybdate ABC transporter substrate-binding protein [Steroidobacteraceae bacterium]